MRLAVVVAASAIALPQLACADDRCAAQGEPVQWVADYCMLKMETDDEIAASGCIEEESGKSFSSPCARKLHFKKAMCEAMIRTGTKAGTVDECVKDPAFKGRVVAVGGVGG